MKGVLLFTAVAGICQCSQLNCTITQTQRGTFYTVPEFTASGCHYSWINGSGSNLVDEFGTKHKSVVDFNITSLHTEGCHEKIEHSRLCSSEGHKKSVTCSTNCTSMMPLSKDKEPTCFWIVGLVLVLLLLMVIVGILYYRHRRGLSSWCSYSAVKQQNDPSNTEDVEAQGREIKLNSI